MAIHVDIAAALTHLEKFLDQGDWRARLGRHRDTLMQPILADAQMGIPDLFRTLEEIGHFSSFAAYVDEAFLCARLEPDDSNPIDGYLKRRGWQETPRARDYLQGMRDSTPAVWEVQATEPGAWVDVRDRLGDGDVVRVSERSASTMLQRYDRVVARVVPARGVHMFTGGVLALMPGSADLLEADLRRLAKRGNATRDAITATCLHIWTIALLRRATQPLPALQTTDGESLTLGRTRLSCATGVNAADVAQRLDTADREGWTRMDSCDAEPTGWVWFGEQNTAREKSEPSTILATLKADGPDAFVVETMSKARMDRALQSLEATLGGLVTAGLTSFEDPMQAIARHRASDPSSSAGAGAPAQSPDFSPDEAAEILRQVNDSHYRRTLDDKVPMLGDRTPRECSRTKAGRKKLVAWLKYLENAELHRAAHDGTKPYDFGWMWRELGVEGER
jgi:hypothetical protein